MLAKRTGSLRTLRFRRSDDKRFPPAHCRTDALPKQASRRQRKRDAAPTGRGMPIRFPHPFRKKSEFSRTKKPSRQRRHDRRHTFLYKKKSGERFRGNTIRDKDSIMHRLETLRRKTDRTLPTSAVAMRILPVRPAASNRPERHPPAETVRQQTVPAEESVFGCGRLCDVWSGERAGRCARRPDRFRHAGEKEGTVQTLSRTTVMPAPPRSSCSSFALATKPVARRY